MRQQAMSDLESSATDMTIITFHTVRDTAEKVAIAKT